MTEYFISCCSGVLTALRLNAQHNTGPVYQQQRRKQCQQLKVAVSDFVRSNTCLVTVPELMNLSCMLHADREYSLALTSCCHASLDLLAAERDSQGTTAALDRLTAQAEICTAKLEAAVLATEDPELTLADSVLMLVRSLGTLQAAMQSMLPVEQDHWVVYEGAIAIKEIYSSFRSTPGRDMMQFLVFTVLAMDTDLTFSLPEHLPLRIDVYLALAQCQQSEGLQAEALVTIQKGLSAIASIEKLEQLDPLPPPLEAQAAYAQAKIRLNTAHFAFTATTLPSEQAVKDALQALLPSDTDRLEALAASLLPSAPHRVVMSQSCPPAVTKLLALAEAMSKPHLTQFKEHDDTADQAPEALPEVQAAITAIPINCHQVDHFLPA